MNKIIIVDKKMGLRRDGLAAIRLVLGWFAIVALVTHDIGLYAIPSLRSPPALPPAPPPELPPLAPPAPV